MSSFLQITFSGLATGAVYALAAAGFALLWQTSGAINFAHGEFLLAQVVVILVIGKRGLTLGVPPWVPIIGGNDVGSRIAGIGMFAGLLVAIPIGVVSLGYLFKRFLVDRLLKGPDELPLVVATIGLGLVIREYVKVEWSATPQPFPSVFGTKVWRTGGVAVSANDIGVFCVSVVLILGLQWFLTRTFVGRQMEATAQSADTARVLGIPVGRMILLTFVLNAILVSAAALLIGPKTNANWDIGISLGVLAFTAAIIGGFNQVRGALAGGLVVGILQNWSGFYFSNTYRDALPLILLIVTILWRPQGLFGRVEARRI